MQVQERSYIEEEMGMMREYHRPQNVFQPRVHVGLCNMRPNLARGFNIVVRKEQSHAIPTSREETKGLCFGICWANREIDYYRIE